MRVSYFDILIYIMICLKVHMPKINVHSHTLGHSNLTHYVTEMRND